MLDEVSLHKHRADVPITKDTIPVQDLIMEMADPYSDDSVYAEKYYYFHYASDAERHVIDERNRKFEIHMKFCIGSLALMVIILVICKLL